MVTSRDIEEMTNKRDVFGLNLALGSTNKKIRKKAANAIGSLANAGIANASSIEPLNKLLFEGVNLFHPSRTAAALALQSLAENGVGNESSIYSLEDYLGIINRSLNVIPPITPQYFKFKQRRVTVERAIIAIKRHIAEEKEQPLEEENPNAKNIAILGSSGSGKTVFFAMISLVLNRSEYTRMKMEYEEGINYIRDIREPLNRGKWPDKTFRDRKELFSAVIYDKEANVTLTHHIFMNDVSGEDFTKYIGPDSDGQLPEHMNHILNASSYIIVISPETLEKDMWTFLSLMKYLIKTKKMKHGELLNEKFAIILSKWDQHNDIVEAENYIMKNAPDFHTSLELRVLQSNLGFFLCSAVGDLTPEGDPRLPLSPIGVVEVIEWVLGKQKSEAPDCMKCMSSLRWISEHNQWYCDKCKEYPPPVVN